MVVALAATLLGIPARAGGGDPIAQMEAVVEHMENAMAQVIDEFEWKLEEAETEAEQWAAYIDCVAEVEYKRDYKLNAIAEIAGGDPELQEARQYFSAMINELADETLQELAEMFEDAVPPSTTTTITLPASTTTLPEFPTTTVSESTTTTHQTTTTTRPRNTTTTKPPRSTTTTTSPASPTPPPSTTVPPTTAPASSTSTTTTTSPATGDEAAPPPPPPSTTTTVPSLFDSGKAGAFAAVNERLTGEQIESLDAESTRLDAEAAKPAALDLAVAFDAQSGLMDGTMLMVDYVGSSLPAPIAAPVISLVAVIEMIVRALLSGTKAFIAPAMVFGVYAGYRSLLSFASYRRAGAAV
jgi:hypothetical protein